MAGDTAAEIVVHAHGSVSPGDRTTARDKVGHLEKLATGPVLYAKVDLIAHADPARADPAFAKAEVDVNGRIARAHASAATMTDAIDLLESRLRQRIERDAHVQESKHLRHRDGAWHHGDEAAQRHAYFPRPAEEREVVRRKTFAMEEMTPEDAVLDLEQLDHDFYLFRNVGTGEDNVVARVAGGGYELIEPSAAAAPGELPGGIAHSSVRPSAMTVDEAIEALDLGELPFLFFLDGEARSGAVVYRRRDGHYGLIEAAGRS